MDLKRAWAFRLGVVLGAGIILVATLAIIPGNASPPSGATTTLFARGAVTTPTGISMKQGTDVVMAQNVFTPGGYSGWHSHPGVAVITVVSGEITIYRENGSHCTSTTYHQGDVFVEQPGDAQNGVNNGSENAVVDVTFFNVPGNGGLTRTERDDPGDCPA